MIKFCNGKNAKIIFMMLFILTFTLLSNAEDKKKWVVQFDRGKAIQNIKDYGRIQFYKGLRSLRTDNSLMLEFGMFHGLDEWYGGWVIGLKYRFRTDKKISPFIYGGGGLIGGNNCGTFLIAASAGIDINMTSRLVVPVTLQFGVNGYQLGPNFISIGLGYRF